MRPLDATYAVIAADLHLSQPTAACRTIASFIIDAYALARQSPDPDTALDEIFRVIEASWSVTSR